MFTQEQIDRALTGRLREMYTALTGKTTVDRNKLKLKKRVEKLNAEAIARNVEAAKAVNAVNAASTAKPNTPLQQTIDRANRRDDIASRAGMKKPGRVAGLSEMLKKGPVEFKTKGHPLDRQPVRHGLAGMKARKVAKSKPVKVDKPRKKPGRKPTAPPRVRTPRTESTTAKLLAGLKKNQILKHVFRQGTGESFTIECKVIKPPGLDGKGGKFRYNGQEYEDLKDVVKASSPTSYNVIYFFKLAPWPKHKNRGKAAD